MEYLVTAREMKRYDEETVSRIGIPALVLMERAALETAREVERRCPAKQGGKDPASGVLVLAGCGNNGADALALSRLLCERGYAVEVVLAGQEEKASPEWKIQRAILANYPVRIGRKPQGREYTVLIDGLLGVGLNREVSGEFAERIHFFNACRGLKIALDLPSGVHTDTGRVMGCAVRADLTVTFAFAKRGLFLFPGREYAGEVVRKEIGIGENSFFGRPPGMFRYTQAPGSLLPARPVSGHKGVFGRVLLVAGAENMAGAAVLSGTGAYRTGAGMVKLLSVRANRAVLQSSLPEALFATAEELEESMDWADVIGVGPGLGRKPEALEILGRILRESFLPLVIDADGLNLLGENPGLQEELALQGEKGRKVILTPHLGELSRLTGIKAAQLKEDMAEYAMNLARRLHCVVVGKGAATLVCREGEPLCLNTAGNSGMATAGSGDVLTGIIAGLLAQGMGDFPAASVGVYLHAKAGEAAAKRLGEYGLMAGDLAQGIAAALQK
ncbi:MAG: NAD(P)H-hydrate dehydratase [Clostridium sp.]|jgi:NAD(P)H-hydrate epimerase|nr:NAD(P)H-hydrate dehydratase [Clostridium sp.]